MSMMSADYTFDGPRVLLVPACAARPPKGPRMRSARLRCCGGRALPPSQLGGAVLSGAARGAPVSAWQKPRRFVTRHTRS